MLALVVYETNVLAKLQPICVNIKAFRCDWGPHKSLKTEAEIDFLLLLFFAEISVFALFLRNDL